MLEEFLFNSYLLKLKMNKISYYYFCVCLFHLDEREAFLIWEKSEHFSFVLSLGEIRGVPSTAPCPAPFYSVWRGSATASPPNKDKAEFTLSAMGEPLAKSSFWLDIRFNIRVW